MALDSSVMNVSIATVASDVGTTVTGIQGAITAYTLVMAMFMIPGGKVGAMIGRKRAFMIGCVVYGCGSLATAIAPNLPVLLFGWSLLEGLGAALLLWESYLVRRGRDPLVDPGLFANRQLTGGLIEFFLQYLVQMGVFFVVPLYLSVALGLSAIKTGVHILTTRYKRWIGIAILLIASVIFVFWSYPTGMVVFWFAFVIVIAFGIREFFAPGPGLVHRDETAVDARGPAPA